ncbi:hypothetical protein WN51_11586 [Melipona quadrifasciata]|uniref:Uncharacterized protein n=1 Tax=Melipona quadrifasciata TaxID=166423 RepID=A0A0M9A348_9HYME|nr:hypothetical protein WN51_11586 [Melipona quadrifasciata]
MLNVVAPGKLVLTLQSIPPFVVESIFALTLAVLLAVPLILRVQHALDSSTKLGSARARQNRGQPENLREPRESEDPMVTTHYPASTFDSTSSSSVDLHLGSARRTISTPTILQASGDDNASPRTTGHWDTAKTRTNVQEIQTTKRNDLILKQSSSFVATNSELPIVDISAFDYDAYRFKLVEAALRRQYDDYQPPGDVVFNSIHLNDNDSTVAVRLNDRYDHSLFDFVEEYYDATKAMSKKETEYLHPLDHFLIKSAQKPETAERETEIERHVVDVADAAGQDDGSPRISFHDDTAVASAQRRHGGTLHKVELLLGRISSLAIRKVDGTTTKKNEDPIAGRNLRSPRPRGPSSAGNDFKASKRFTLRRSSAKGRNAAIFSRTNSSTDSISSKRDTPSQRREDRRGETLSSIDGAERESTISSVGTESARSESSKIRDDNSARSRDSSVASRRRAREKPRVSPWLTGNPRTSFNKKYGSLGKDSSNMFEASRRSSTTRKPSFLDKQRASKQSSIRRNLNNVDLSVFSRSSDKVEDGLRFNDGRLDDQTEKLESIKSETDPSRHVSKDALESLGLNSTVNPSDKRNALTDNVPDKQRSSAKNSHEANPPGVRLPETIDRSTEIARQTAGAPRLARTESNEENAREQRSGKLSAKLDEVAGDGKQGSPPVKPVSPKQPARHELSADASLSGQQPRKDLANFDRCKRYKNTDTPLGGGEEKKKLNKENRRVETFDSENVKNRRAKTEGKPRARGRNTTESASLGGRRDEKTARIDVNRRGGWDFGSTSTARSNLSNAAASKRSQQRTTTDSPRVNASLRDNVIGARSMGIRSSKPATTGERKLSRGGRPEKSEASRSESRENGLKLPRRDSKAGIAMQVGLKKYIKRLKRVLSDRDNTDIGQLASLSLTDAILPDLESTLSSVEVQEVQNLLNMAEKKSKLTTKNPPTFEKKAF